MKIKSSQESSRCHLLNHRHHSQDVHQVFGEVPRHVHHGLRANSRRGVPDQLQEELPHHLQANGEITKIQKKDPGRRKVLVCFENEIRWLIVQRFTDTVEVCNEGLEKVPVFIISPIIITTMTFITIIIVSTSASSSRSSS